MTTKFTDYRLTQLYAVGSKPSSQHAYYGRTYKGLLSKVSEIVDVVCNPRKFIKN